MRSDTELSTHLNKTNSSHLPWELSLIVKGFGDTWWLTFSLEVAWKLRDILILSTLNIVLEECTRRRLSFRVKFKGKSSGIQLVEKIWNTLINQELSTMNMRIVSVKSCYIHLPICWIAFANKTDDAAVTAGENLKWMNYKTNIIRVNVWNKRRNY